MQSGDVYQPEVVVFDVLLYFFHFFVFQTVLIFNLLRNLSD